MNTKMQTRSASVGARAMGRKAGGGEEEVTTGAVKQALEKINSQVSEFRAGYADRLQDVEQKLAARKDGHYMASGGAPLFDTADLAANTDFKRLQAREKGAAVTIRLDQCSVKAMFNDNGDADTGNSLLPARPDWHGLRVGPQRALSLFDLLPVEPTSSNAVEYVRLSLDSTADVQPGEGELKQEGELVASLETARIETIAVWSGISAQCLGDTASLLNAVGNILRNAVRDKSEQQIFVGSGTGSGFFITGLYSGAIALTAYENAIPDRIGRAVTTMETSGYQPSLIALNPSDWFDISILKDEEGNYIYGNPANPARPALWNRPILTSPSVPVGQALIIDASKVAILDREQPSLYLTRDHLDFAVRNMVLVLAEMRLGLAVYDLNAVRKVDLSVAT